MRILFKTTTLMAAFGSSTYPASFALSVNLSDSIRPVTHAASGSLYGITETLPTDINAMAAPLKPHALTNPALSGTGRQQPIGAAIPVAKRVASLGTKVQIRLPDVLPGWPYKWPGQATWLNEVKNVIAARKASGLTNFDGYEIWNEPPDTWPSANGDFNTLCWKPTYDLIKAQDPGMRVIGPSFAYYNNTRMSDFLKFAKANNCLPEVISWHQWGSGGFVGALESYRALERTLGISPRAISINEYSSKTSDPYEGCPGYSVPFIAKFERHGVESAMLSWWFTALPGRMGSLLTANNQKGGGWHLYKWYGDMTGAMVKTVPPNDKSDGVDAFAAIDKSIKVASIVLGGNNIGTVNVNISGVPSSFGSNAIVKLESVTWSDKDTPVSGTTAISTKTYAVSNGSISVPVEVTNQFHAYRIYITPAASTVVPPVIKITATSSTGSFTAPATVSVDATASDADGTVSHIDFYDGATLVHSEWPAPYAWEWVDVTAGTHVLKAIAYDNDGNTAQDSVTIVVKNGSVGILQSVSRELTVHQVYDLQGNRVGAVVTDGSRSLGKAVGQLTGRSGIYVTRHLTAKGIMAHKVEVP